MNKAELSRHYRNSLRYQAFFVAFQGLLFLVRGLTEVPDFSVLAIVCLLIIVSIFTMVTMVARREAKRSLGV